MMSDDPEGTVAAFVFCRSVEVESTLQGNIVFVTSCSLPSGHNHVCLSFVHSLITKVKYHICL
jgi:hypothetical protein